MNSHPLSPSPDAAHLDLDFLKHTLTGMLFPAKYKPAAREVLDACPVVLRVRLRDHDQPLLSTY